MNSRMQRVVAGVDFDFISSTEIEYSIQYNQTIEYKNGQGVDKVSKYVLPVQVGLICNWLLFTFSPNTRFYPINPH